MNTVITHREDACNCPSRTLMIYQEIPMRKNRVQVHTIAIISIPSIASETLTLQDFQSPVGTFVHHPIKCKFVFTEELAGDQKSELAGKFSDYSRD